MEFSGSNEDETMRIDAATTETLKSCASHSSSEEVDFLIFFYVRALHMAKLYQMSMEIQNE